VAQDLVIANDIGSGKPLLAAWEVSYPGG
jgi:hypothetical protein